MNAIIIEDEPRARQMLESLLEQHFPEITVIGTAASVREALNCLDLHDGEQAPAPDVIFMDVELSDGTCFDLFARRSLPAPVIMTTAYDQYAVKAFEVHSLDYLLKPIDVEDLRRALSRVGERRPETDLRALSETLRTGAAPKEKFLIRLNDRIVPVAVKEIAYFYSESKSSYIVTRQNRSYVLDDSLDALEESLDPKSFFRISRNCIVSEGAIESVSKLLGGRLRISLQRGIDAATDLTVSRARVGAFLSWLEG